MSTLLTKQNETDILTLLNALRTRSGIDMGAVSSVIEKGERAKASDINYVVSKILELKNNKYYAYN